MPAQDEKPARSGGGRASFTLVASLEEIAAEIRALSARARAMRAKSNTVNKPDQTRLFDSGAGASRTSPGRLRSPLRQRRKTRSTARESSQAAVHAARLRWKISSMTSASRRVSEHARYLCFDASRAQLDATAADRLGRAGGLQQAAAGNPAHGATAISLIPCNSVYRGYDADEVPPELLGTCGVIVNSVEDMDIALANVPIDRISCALNDPSPFTLLALLLAVARRRGIGWDTITGTSNQSDYLSHCVANHMFFRLALPGARRVLTDHIAFANECLPGWNPLFVVGHTRSSGATPPKRWASRSQRGTSVRRRLHCTRHGSRPLSAALLTFFDISISFFEEIASSEPGAGSGRAWRASDSGRKTRDRGVSSFTDRRQVWT